MMGARAARAYALASFVIALFAGAAVSCDQLEPETGDRLLGCSDADSDPTRAVSFKNDIRPLMNGDVPGTTGCKNCHYESTGTHQGLIETGLNLETLRTIRLGGRETPPSSILVPGRPCSSALVKKLQGTFGGARMPKGGPYWDAAKIQIVMDWIAEGAQGADSD
jgi:hypothetical protein